MLTEEGVRKRYGINTLHLGIFEKLRINEEEHRHIHGLTRVQSLL